MKFETRLTQGNLIRRYKRFLADVALDDGTEITVHVPNTGSMRSSGEPGSRVVISHHPGAGRKLEWTLELVRAEGRHWVGVNTALTNRIVEEAVAGGRIGPLKGYGSIRREVNYGKGSRVDLLLEGARGRCYVEVKNVTYKEDRRALFPDAVTARGTRHLRELREMVAQGHRAVIFFLVNRGDCSSMGPARAIDPLYSEVLEEVVAGGVECLAYRASPDPTGIAIEKKLKVYL